MSLTAVREIPDLKIVLREDKSLHKELGKAFRQVVKEKCPENYRHYFLSIKSLTLESFQTGIIRFNRKEKVPYYYCISEKKRAQLPLTLYDKFKQRILLKKIAQAALESLCNGQMSMQTFWSHERKDYIFARLNHPDEKLIKFLNPHGVNEIFLTESDIFVVTFTKDGSEFDIGQLIDLILSEKVSLHGSSS